MTNAEISEVILQHLDVAEHLLRLPIAVREIICPILVKVYKHPCYGGERIEVTDAFSVVVHTPNRIAVISPHEFTSMDSLLAHTDSVLEGLYGKD